jgi:hypothetical protein
MFLLAPGTHQTVAPTVSCAGQPQHNVPQWAKWGKGTCRLPASIASLFGSGA